MMSIRFRFTVLYNGILALTLVVFGVSLYFIQSQSTWNSLKAELVASSNQLEGPLLKTNEGSGYPIQNETNVQPRIFTEFSDDQVFRDVPEREIVRILDSSGNLLASPFGLTQDQLPLSSAGLTAIQANQDWFETGNFQSRPLLIYSHPVSINGKLVYILQVARPLVERDSSLKTLELTLIAISLVTMLIAIGIGWIFSGITLKPIQRITHTAQAIGKDRDFSRRVDYRGPPDEVGQLATTFNSMLSNLEGAFKRIERTLENQREFVADVSHELRTPLTTLRGNLELLDRHRPLNPGEQSEILTDMVTESDRMIKLVNDLLILARADINRTLQKQAITIAPILEEACRLAQTLDPKRMIRIDADDLRIEGDHDALKQVMLIALDNAVKHSTGDIHVIAFLEKGRVLIQVQDFGDGIPKEKLGLIFERFYRGAENTNMQGFGLGLPIAKALVEAMGGSILMESELGKGSQLKVTFPSVNEDQVISKKNK